MDTQMQKTAYVFSNTISCLYVYNILYIVAQFILWGNPYSFDNNLFRIRIETRLQSGYTETTMNLNFLKPPDWKLFIWRCSEENTGCLKWFVLNTNKIGKKSPGSAGSYGEFFFCNLTISSNEIRLFGISHKKKTDPKGTAFSSN